MKIKSWSMDKNEKRTELEATLYMATKLMLEKANNGGKGVIFNKGEDNELRLTYDDMVDVMDDLWGYFEVYERFKKSHCGTCVDYIRSDETCRGIDNIGRCRNQNTNVKVHRFSGCDIGRRKKRRVSKNV